MATATGWVRHHPGVLVLLAAVILGQLLQKLAEPFLRDSPLIGQVPVVPALTLLAALALALLIIYLRVRLGQQLTAAARQRALALPDPATLPKRYAVQDAPGQVTSGGLGLVDLALLLLCRRPCCRRSSRWRIGSSSRARGPTAPSSPSSC